MQLKIVAQIVIGNVEHVNNFIFIIIKGWNIFFLSVQFYLSDFYLSSYFRMFFLKPFFSKYLFLRGLLKDVDNNDIYLNVKLLNIPKYPFQSASGWDERQN